MSEHQMPERTVGTVTVSTARSYHISFKPSGWAIFTVNDETGELSIQSDWGDLSHRWGQAGLGAKTISQALATWLDAHYVCTKLHYGRDREEFDSDATEAAVKREIIAARREGRIDRGKARDLWFDLYHYASGFGNADQFVLLLTEDIRDFLDYPAYDYIERRPTFRWCVFLELLLPAFFDALRADLGIEAA